MTSQEGSSLVDVVPQSHYFGFLGTHPKNLVWGVPGGEYASCLDFFCIINKLRKVAFSCIFFISCIYFFPEFFGGLRQIALLLDNWKLHIQHFFWMNFT